MPFLHQAERFTLADGTSITRPVGIARFEVAGATGGAPAIFGEPGNAWLLRALSLEALGLVLDPFERKLCPTRVTAAPMSRARLPPPPDA